jgi:hypothetical protein
MEILSQIIGAQTLKAAGGVFGVAACLWVIGLFQGSKAYAGLRNALGKFSENLGRQVSRLGNSRLKGLYEPIESVAVDFFLFMAEQFAVGLRKDNQEEMAKHVERLEGVGSETRAAAIKAKLETSK